MKIFFTILFVLVTIFCVAQPKLDWVTTSTIGASKDVVEDVFVDAAGNSYACGNFTGSLRIGATTYNAGTTTQAFVVKYDVAGLVLWSRVSTGDDKAFAHTIHVDDLGCVYIAGHHTSTTTTFGSLIISTIANEELFIVKYSPTGVPIRAMGNDLTNNGKCQILGMTGNNNNIFVTGFFFQNPIKVGGKTSLVPTQNDIFIASIDSNLAAAPWLASHGGVGSRKEYGTGITINGNNLFVCGYSDNISFTVIASGTNYTIPNATKNAPWLLKCSTVNGNVDWATTGVSFKGNSAALDVVADANNVYMTGFYSDSTMFVTTPSKTGPFTYGTPLLSKGGSDIFVAKYNNTGILQSVWTDGGIGNDQANGITIASTCSKIQICGRFQNNVNFGGSELLSASGDDMFVASYDFNGVFDWAFQQSSSGYESANKISAKNGRSSFGGEFTANTTFTTTPAILKTNNGGSDHFTASFRCANAIVCDPDITCRKNDTVTAGPSCKYILGSYIGQDTIVDGCGLGYTETQFPLPGDTLGPGVHPISMTVTDLNGNSDVCIFYLVVQANVNPTLVSCGTWLPNQTTFGHGNTVNSFGCVGYNTPGEDVYYQIDVPAGNYWIQFTIDSVTDVNDSYLETFWVGGSCPLGGGCSDSKRYNIATQSFVGGGNDVQYLAVGPATYYFVVDARNDGINNYNFSVACLESGIEFDNSVSCGDPNNDGIIPKVNGLTTLTTQPCQAVNICHDMYLANKKGFEWVDSVYLKLGSCYQNVVPTNTVGNYQPGNWISTYNAPTSSINWQFNNSSNPLWGDGSGGYYACDSAKTRKYTFCFNSNISSMCANDTNLNIEVFVYDDGVGSSTNTVPGVDYVLSNFFTINNPPPTITCPANVSTNTDVGVCTKTLNGIAPVTTGDNCPNPFVTYVLTGATTGSGLTDASGTIFNLGITNVKYIITDSLGAKDSCNFNVTITDNVNPVITCVGNVSVGNDAGVCTAVVNNIAPVTATENCTIDSINYVITGVTTASGLNNASGTVFNLGISNVAYTITDASGNTTTCNFNVTVVDDEVPIITCISNQTVYVDNNCDFSIPDYTGTTTSLSDNCTPTGSITLSQFPALGTIISGHNTTQTITIYATDLDNNTDSCSFVITLNDTIKPTITCSGNVNENFTAACSFILPNYSPISVVDNCTPSLSINVSQIPTAGSTITSDTLITLIADDGNGNLDSCSFMVLLTDNINPIVVCPNDTMLDTDNGVCTAAISFGTPVNSDNCSVSSLLNDFNNTNDASGVYPKGLTTVNWTVIDNTANSTSCNFNVTVVDNEVPIITCISNQTVYVDNNCDFSIPDYTGTTTSLSDNCTPTGSITLSQYPTLGTIISGHNTTQTITIYATDLDNNTDSCSFVITLNDTIKPTITCSGNVNENFTSACSFILPNYSPISVLDNCTPSLSIIVTQIPAAGSTVTSDTLITLIADDGNGNVYSCSFMVLLTDNINPVVICPNDTILNTDNGVCTAAVSFGTPVNSDNCSVSSLLNDFNNTNDASGVYPKGLTTVTWTVIDNTANAATCSFNVTVVDNEVPVITCISNQTVYVDNNCDFSIPDYTGTTTSLSDNCTPTGSITLSQYPTLGTIISGHNTTQTITIYATDLDNNTDSCSFVITLNDTIKPTITCAGNVNENFTAACSFILPNYSPISVVDNCTPSLSIIVTQIPAAGSTITSDTLITLFADDGNGNLDSCSFMVLLTDNINPVVICPNDTILNTDNGVCTAAVSFGTPVNSDNCSVSSLLNDFNNTNDASGVYPKGLTTVTWTVIDNTANAATCSFNVTVVDNEVPVITCISDTTLSTDPNMCDAVLNFSIIASDNCSYFTAQTDGLASGSSFPIGNTLNTYVVTDSSGLSSTCSFTVTVIDNQLPTIICPNNIVICSTNVVVPQPTVSDNCFISSFTNNYNNTSNATDVYPVGVSNITWTVSDTNGNNNSCIMTVQVDANPTVANAGKDQRILTTQPTQFEANTPSIGIGYWSLISGYGYVEDLNNPISIITNLENGNNIFRWSVKNGTCPESIDDVIITSLGLEIPNGFSPNGDNNNDVLVINGIEKLTKELIIFNRWGVQLYSQVNYQNNWSGVGSNGNNLPEDTYFYILKLPELNIEQSGYIVLKR